MTRLIHALAALLSATSIVGAAHTQSNPASPAVVQSDLREAELVEAGAVQADPACGDLDACYRTAQAARAEGLFVRYLPMNNSQTQIDVLGCDYRVGRCSVQTASPGPNILRDFKWSLPLGSPGQGLQYGQHTAAASATEVQARAQAEERYGRFSERTAARSSAWIGQGVSNYNAGRRSLRAWFQP